MARSGRFPERRGKFLNNRAYLEYHARFPNEPSNLLKAYHVISAAAIDELTQAVRK
jgi:hypothetical protein